MKLFCKELKGNEVALDGLENDTRIADVKKQIEDKLNIPVSQQKLLYLGKILQDNLQLKDYKIQENAKLMITRVAKPDLKKIINTHFSRFFDQETSNTMANLFVENLKLKLKNYSLDDLDRLAEAFLKESENASIRD